jgi:hypothetical protein
MNNNNIAAEKVKMNLYRNCPKANLVTVEMRKLHNHDYESKIRVFTDTQSFYASKSAVTHHDSLEKSYHAMIKQLERAKPDSLHLKREDKTFLDESA